MAQPESIPAEASPLESSEELVENPVEEVAEAAEAESSEPLPSAVPEPLAEVPPAAESRSETSVAKTPPPPSRTQSSGRGAMYLAAALAVGLLLCGLALINQGQEVLALRGEVDSLGAQLAESEQQVAEYEATIAQVRVEVSEVIARMMSLQGLVGGPPEDAAVESSQDTSSAAEPGGEPADQEEVLELAPAVPAVAESGEASQAADQPDSAVAADVDLPASETPTGAISSTAGAYRPLDAFGDPLPMEPFVGEAPRDDILLERY